MHIRGDSKQQKSHHLLLVGFEYTKSGRKSKKQQFGSETQTCRNMAAWSNSVASTAPFRLSLSHKSASPPGVTSSK